MAQEDGIDRLSIRQRPKGPPVMHQSWCKLLFMHWQLAPELLRPHIPGKLQVDTFEGRAWVGIAPFVARSLRPSFLPPIPWLSDLNEVDVRTCVRYQGVPDVVFSGP